MRLSILKRAARSWGKIPCRAKTNGLSTDAIQHPPRSYLYVPCSSDRMLQKSLVARADVTIYDLEDSISPQPTDKENARKRLKTFLHEQQDLLDAACIAVRMNDITSPFFQDDVRDILINKKVSLLVLPKIHSVEDMNYVSDAINAVRQQSEHTQPLRLIASIESAKGLWNLGDIAGWKSKYVPQNGGILSSLLFAAEDYCADTSIIRSRSRTELLYARSQIMVAARVFGLGSIDMVCVNYRDLTELEDECKDGRRMGFHGKQAIHPAQIETINTHFVPTRSEIIRAAKVIEAMDRAHASEKGAVGVEGEMMDAPMLKQATYTLAVARAVGVEIPEMAWKVPG